MTGSSDRPEHLLVVEDSQADLRLITEAFGDGRLETTVHAVSSVEKAFEFVDQRGEHADAPEPDVLLLDWDLPETEGKEALAEITADVPEVPVVVMTGTRAKTEAARRSEGFRADAYLTKPSDPAEYVEVVRSVY